MERKINVQKLCAILEIPRATYYRWKKESKRFHTSQLLKEMIRVL
ncbi:hypothetical protein ACQKMN_17730 [Ureibacillus composti]